MKKITLTHGYSALVDDEDFLLLSRFKWYYDGRYARRRDYKLGKQIRMHRQIMGNSSKEIDHINGNGLDNRRENLRFCTKSQNNMNRKLQSNNRSGYKGVSWWEHRRIWKATIKAKGKAKHLLYTPDPKEAVLAYNKAATSLYGDFAKLNII